MTPINLSIQGIRLGPWFNRFFVWLLLAAPLAAGTVLPPGFSEVQIADVADGTALAVAPDGRIFVCEQSGALRIIQNNVLLPTPFMTLAVNGNGERGLLGICLDPNFSVNNYLYVYYTVPTAPIHNRVSRFTANGNVMLAGSELILADLDNLSAAENHNGGALHFGPDGKLYVAVGENATASFSQVLTNRLGKILRINPDAPNSIPTDNPFYATATGLNRSIWALGLRNPFTFAFHRLSGRMFINDVGGNGVNTTEEVNNGVAGANYGWPTTEGNFVQASFPAFTRPFHAYNSGMTTDCAIIGASFYDPPVAQFPPAYQDLYFFGDYCGAWIKTLNPATPLPLTTTVGAQNFATATGPLVDLAVDRSNGSLIYYRANGNVVRVTYTGSLAPYIGSQPSSVTVTAGGGATFCVSAGGSPLPTLRWQRNGVDIAGATNTCYTLAPALLGDHLAQFRAIATNVNGSATSTAAVLYVTANTPPSPVIVSPTAGLFYSAGQSYALAGTATDSEDGSLAGAGLSWTVVFHHDLHTHPFYGPVTGSGGSLSIPNVGETATDVWYRVHLRAVDSGGLSTTVQRDIFPVLVTFTVQSAPVPLSVTVDGLPGLAPRSVLSVQGMLREIGAVSPQSGYSFSNWSDGLGQTHFVTASAGASFTANFTVFTPTASPTRTPSTTPSLTNTRSPTPTQSPTATASPTPSGAIITDFGLTWSPRFLTVTAGTTVTWSWAGTHNVVSDSALFSSGGPATGAFFQHTFNTAGTFPYRCDVHVGLGMTGVIYVLGLPTATATTSPTRTPSATASPSPSTSPTRTASASPSPSSTPTISPTATSSVTQTLTLSASPTSSPSPTASASPSASASTTDTPTASPVVSATESPTVTQTSSTSPSPSASASVTDTPTASPVASPTSSTTVTQTWSPSASPSTSPTATPSTSQTPSPTSTLGVNSPTVSATVTPTGSPSASPSASPTATPSTSPTPSPTSTLGVNSPTVSASPTASPSLTATETSVPAVPPTATPTPASMSGELVVLEALAWPQPGPRWVSLKLSGPAEEVRLHLYSSAMNRIHSLDLGPSPAGWSRVALPAEWLETAQGLYFVRVEAQRGRQHSPAFQPLTLYLLR